MPSCKSCGRRIAWVRTLAGKAMPLDLPCLYDGTGTVTLVGTPKGEVAVVRRPGDPPAARSYRTHWETCPTAAAHRGKPKIARAAMAGRKPKKTPPGASQAATQRTLFDGEKK